MNKAADVILRGMEEKGLTQSEVARRLGEDVRNLNKQLNRQNDMKVRRFIDVMECIGYGVRLEEREFFKATPQYVEQIIRTGAPSGLFYCEIETGWFVAVDNTHPELFVEEFSSFDEMTKWFANYPCINSEGFEVNG